MSSTTSPTPTTSELPSRAATGLSTFSEDAIPEADPSHTAGLLAERLQAWKHAVAYLEEYVEATEKIHGRHAKEYEKVLKTISSPLREGHHFDQSLGGVAGLFENMRSNTQAIINTNLETEKSLKGSVLPILERLHKEIKNKTKELHGGAGKNAKEIEKLRNITQKHIESLGSQTASFESAGGRIQAHDDPYIIRRGVLHRLSNQVIAENNHRNDLISVQNNMQMFENHVVEVIQQAIEAFNQFAGGQAEKTRALYGDMLGTAQCVPRDFEWANFSTRCADRLANPNEPARSVDAIQFPNVDHHATKALIEGSLERKSRNKLAWGFSTGYYVVTPSKYLHEFKDSDDTRQDPKPELSVYLPEAVIGTPSGDKFNVKGKDTSKTMSSKLAGSSELSFKAHTAADAQKWFEVLSTVAGATGPVVDPTSPVSRSPSTFSADSKVQSPVQASSPSQAISPSQTKAEAPPSDEHKAQVAGVTPAAEETSKKAEAAQ